MFSHGAWPRATARQADPTTVQHHSRRDSPTAIPSPGLLMCIAADRRQRLALK